jgi:Domain of unknown function (DUF4326)
MRLKTPLQRPKGGHRLLVPAEVDLGPPRVVHCMREHHHVYIGRGSDWGNPFRIGRDGTRREVIERHELYVYEHPELLASIQELRGLVLGCYCAPYPCHGDLYVRLANAPRRGASVAEIARGEQVGGMRRCRVAVDELADHLHEQPRGVPHRHVSAIDERA